MSYSTDLRKKVLAFLSEGGTQKDAAKLFNIGTTTIYCWKKRKSLTPTPRKTWQNKINKQELIQHVKDFPDMILRERAEHFNVKTNAIWNALRRLKIHKKNDIISGKDVYKTH